MRAGRSVFLFHYARNTFLPHLCVQGCLEVCSTTPPGAMLPGFPLIREIRENFEDFFQSGKSGKTGGFNPKSGEKMFKSGNFFQNLFQTFWSDEKCFLRL